MKEFKLDKIKATGTTVGDVHFPNVKLLLPFDGSNGATSTSDSSNSNQSVTFSNSAEISTAQSKFGGSSLSCPDGLTSDVSTSWNAMPTGTEDFTIETWVYLLDRTGGGRNETSFGIWGNRNTSGSDSIQLYVGYPDANMLAFLINDTAMQVTTTWNYTSNLNAWHHIALTRASNTFRLFVDGTQVGTTTSTTSMTKSFSDLFIGSSGHTWSTVRCLRGYIEDFRITRGTARYTSAFTAPSSAHLTSAGDVNKHIIVNSDADGVAIGTGGINQARIAKAWVNFNGTSTVAIRSSYNVSSITDNGTGDYTANLSTALSDTNGAAVAMTGYVDHTWGIPLYKDVSGSNPLTTTQFRVATVEPETTSVTYYDQEQVSILIFGN